MTLLRRMLGDVLRRHRLRQSRTLRDVSVAAGVSLGYLSEVERGRKEASSELLAAICAALDVSLAEVLREVSDDLDREERRSRVVPVGFSRSAPTWTTPDRVARQVAGVSPITPRRPGGPTHPDNRPATPVGVRAPHAAVTVAPVAAAMDSQPRPVVAA
jgi:transcriptional regulator with XRE-family HTH domain